MDLVGKDGVNESEFQTPYFIAATPVWLDDQSHVALFIRGSQGAKSSPCSSRRPFFLLPALDWSLTFFFLPGAFSVVHGNCRNRKIKFTRNPQTLIKPVAFPLVKMCVWL